VTFLVAVTAALVLYAPPSHASAVPEPPGKSVIRAHGANAARYVRLRLDVVAYGVRGRGEIVVDRATGRFVRRFDAGPVSEREGWDGANPWRADATGMARIQGNADERAAIVEWSRLLAPSERAPAHEHASLAPEVTVEPSSGLVTGIVRHIGAQTERTTFGDYRDAGDFRLPFALADESDNGAWSARIVTVETPRSVPDAAFAPPPAPHDTTLQGVDVVPLDARSEFPLIAVSINDGPPLRFLLDTGGQNVITPEAARRAGLEPVGGGTVGGAGASLAKVRFASARSVRVGTAVLRDQPFLVLDLGAAAPFDGIVGYELFARFAARIDFAHHRLELARDVAELGGSGVVVPMSFAERQPQVEGALDGIPGVMTIDTGSVSSVDVASPFVVEHGLRERYHADVGGYPIAGIGGPVHAYFAHANEVRLGSLRIPDVKLLLTDARSGAEANPTLAANVGTQVLRRFNLVLDYRGGTIRFETPNR
jgi:aspartyl protease